MLDKIVVPLDGSDLAEEVLPVVEELGLKLSADVVLLQAVTTLAEATRQAMAGSGAAAGLSTDLATQRVESETDAAARYLKTVSERLQAKGLKVSTALTEGLAAGAILEYAKESNASLIALSTHGRGGLSRAVTGSVADAVVRHSDVPVLLVRVGAVDL
jgi:nucleotide-binding universal stress UspA family protein